MECKKGSSIKGLYINQLQLKKNKVYSALNRLDCSISPVHITKTRPCNIQ